MIETVDKLSKEKQLEHWEKIIKESAGRAEGHSNDISQIQIKLREHQSKILIALENIRTGELYKPQYKTFTSYCEQKWKYSRRRVNELLRTHKLLKDSKTSGMPLTSRSAEALASVPEEQREEVIEEAKKSGKVTGKSVKAAAKKTASSKSKPERPKDKKGYPIPERAWALCDRRNEVKEKIRPLSELKGWIEDMQGTDDPLWVVRGLHFNNLLTTVGALIFQFQQALPDRVCTKCQGANPECDFCYGRGMISTSLADGVETPIEMKEIREKLASNHDSPSRLSGASR